MLRVLRKLLRHKPEFVAAPLSFASESSWTALSIVKSYCKCEVKDGIRYYKSVGGEWVSEEVIDRLSDIMRTVRVVEHALYREFRKPGADSIDRCLDYAPHLGIAVARANQIWEEAKMRSRR